MVEARSGMENEEMNKRVLRYYCICYSVVPWKMKIHSQFRNMYIRVDSKDQTTKMLNYASEMCSFGPSEAIFCENLS